MRAFLKPDLAAIGRFSHAFHAIVRLGLPAALAVAGLLLFGSLAGAQQQETAAPPVFRPSTLADPDLNRLDDLIRTAFDLQEVGRKDEARALRPQIEQCLRNLAGRIASAKTGPVCLESPADQPAQIMLEFRLLELNRSKIEKLGFDFARFTAPKAKSQEAERPRQQAKQAAEIGVCTDQHQAKEMRDAIEALREDGLVRVLAEPRIVVFSGRSARFRCGGEHPFEVTQPDGTQRVEFRQYGTTVETVATVFAKGTIRLDLRACVTLLDAETKDENGNPAMNTREVDTSVVMKSGETLVIHGLVGNRKAAARLPLGSPKDEQIELIVLATSHIIESLAGWPPGLVPTR